MCDFRGFEVPEMIKVRPVIVVSPRLPYRDNIVAVVPLSLTPPMRTYPYTVQLSRNYNPLEVDELPVWAKCDMLMNLGRHRLDGFKVGRRKWETPQATGEDLAAVRAGVLAALGIRSLDQAD